MTKECISTGDVPIQHRSGAWRWTETMLPLGERQVMIEGDAFAKGYERAGEDHCQWPLSDEEIEIRFQGFLKMNHQTEEQLPKELVPLIKGMLSQKPYIEGAWMDKWDGKYYLQYACPGAQYNVYADGVYIGDSPLGPFTLAKNNPFSYKPGGFLPGCRTWFNDGGYSGKSVAYLDHANQCEPAVRASCRALAGRKGCRRRVILQPALW